MSQLFLSHSSHDNFHAIALRDWLIGEGWDDLFLDLDPERGIVAGERWERALHQAASRCDAVLFLVSSNWLSSEWCLREFDLAHRLNKRIFGLLIEDIEIDQLPSRLTETWQLVQLAGGRDHKRFDVTHPQTGEEGYVYFSEAGLKSLRSGLQRAGLDPKFFEWPPGHDPQRPPYRGLRPLEADDAGIFFGREAPTIELISRLRGLRERSAPRLLAILGASGAGKSSFLRAGLLPRLAREDQHFLPLPVLRPEIAALSGESGLVAVLVEGLKPLKLARARISEALGDANQIAEWLMQAVQQAARDPDAQFARLPTLILSIDQAEELFLGEGREEAETLLNLLRDLAGRDELPLIVMFTIRSDSYDALQHAKALEGMPQETFSLVPMPKGAYAEVIRGPAKRLKATDRKLEIEPALIDTLLSDLDRGGSSDALPLLAFTLERLYRDFGDSGELTEIQYRDRLKGIGGSIKAATEEVFKSAQTNSALPKDRRALEALARRALIPWLTGIDLQTQTPRRRVARMRDIPYEARPLIDEMIEQRLLTTNRNKLGEVTVEPAHEALLRQWGLLKGWLKEDLGALSTLEGIQRATRDWLANAKAETWLNHSAGRLEEAETVSAREDLQGFLAKDEQVYLRQCRMAYDARTQKELQDARELAAANRKVVRRTRMALAISSTLAAIAVIAAGLAYMALQTSSDLTSKLRAATLNPSVAFEILQDQRYLDQTLNGNGNEINYPINLMEMQDSPQLQSTSQEIVEIITSLIEMPLVTTGVPLKTFLVDNNNEEFECPSSSRMQCEDFLKERWPAIEIMQAFLVAAGSSSAREEWYRSFRSVLNDPGNIRLVSSLGENLKLIAFKHSGWCGRADCRWRFFLIDKITDSIIHFGVADFVFYIGINSESMAENLALISWAGAGRQDTVQIELLERHSDSSTEHLFETVTFGSTTIAKP